MDILTLVLFIFTMEFICPLPLLPIKVFLLAFLLLKCIRKIIIWMGLGEEERELRIYLQY